MKLNRTLIKQLEKSTGLLYEENPVEGNVCFRTNNEELRDDFKEIFTMRDLKNFIKSFNGEKIILPKNNLEFWEKVKIGGL